MRRRQTQSLTISLLESLFRHLVTETFSGGGRLSTFLNLRWQVNEDSRFADTLS